MTIKRRNYLIGGFMSKRYKQETENESSWLKTDCLRLIDQVTCILGFLPSMEFHQANKLLEHIYQQHKVNLLPNPPEHWGDSRQEIQRLYWLIKKSAISMDGCAVYLLDKIKIDDDYFHIKDSNQV